MVSQRLRTPRGLWPAAMAVGSGVTEAQLCADQETLRGVIAGLDRLEALTDQTPVLAAASQRGYFTPDEDDRVRQALLVYRNYRLAAYDIIFRQRDFLSIPDESLRWRSFLVGFAAALTLYAKSLKIIRIVEHQPLLRAKLNEPDAKFDLEPGFFDDVLIGYSSPSNYRALAYADRFWRGQRRTPVARRLGTDPEWGWLGDSIRHRRVIVRRRLFDVLLRRLRYDWRAFWQTVLSPARQTRYDLQSLLGGHFAGVHLVPKSVHLVNKALLGGHFAGVHLVPNSVHVLTKEVLGGLRPQLRPGDVLLCRAEGKLTAALLPGFWSHAAIYLGSRAELEALGVRKEPHAAKRWEEIPASCDPLGCVIEGVAPCVRISALEASLVADHLLVLRPQVSSADLAAALGEAFGHLGKPYDFEFDFSVSHRIVCTELVYRCYHHRGAIEFPLVKRLGRFTLSGDDIVHLALDELGKAGGPERAPLRPVSLILKRRDGRAHATPPHRVVTLLRRIRRGWRPARRASTQTHPEPSA